MAGRRRDETQVADNVLLPPFEFGDAPGGHTPVFEVGAHAEGHDEGHIVGDEAPDGGEVEMIVLIVLDDDGIQWRQLVEG